ncbi:restriction endonuclease subunit S [Micromonospora sp. WMMD714]|uniref:restriction endonuclease subunit S n=1 Tax=Micromonospora sp. WMMD714 TaxID=3016097 RepID=UPI00249B8427|nr:restriction endonuclease subunit S [Micromonospora sp. WMMD714]WFE66976.1 restriction endonuclease subunit S [Micromonospora sp. WMMD714]
MTDLPPGWEYATLGEIAETSLGKMLDRSKGTGRHLLPYLRNVNVQWGRIDVLDILSMDIPPEQQEHYRIRSGDLLVCEGGDIGRCAIWRDDGSYMAFQKALHRVRPLGGIDSRYLRLFLEHLSVSGKLAAYATGSTIKHLPQEQLRKIAIALPPLAEQCRIVAVIEEQVVRLDAACQQVHRAAARAVRLRDAGWDYVRLNAQGGELVRLGDILAVPLRNGHSAPAAVGGTVRTLTLTAVTRSKFVDDFTKMTAVDPLRVGDLWLKSGDILIQRSNTPELVGTAAIYEGPDDWAIFPDLVIRVRVKETALSAFVALMLQTPAARNYFRSRAKGLAGSMPKIDQQVVQDFSFRLPSRDRQAAIVDRSREFLALVDRISDTCQRSLRKARLLRSSLLAEAFAGRLVPQDPNDEPAAELLARIRAERSTAIPKQRTRARRTPKELAAPPTRVTGDDYQQETLPL